MQRSAGSSKKLPRCRTSPPRIQVIIFRSTASYRSYLQNRIPQAVQRRAIFYQNGNILQIYAVNHPAEESFFRQFLEEIEAGGAPGDFSEWSQNQGVDLSQEIGGYFRRFQFASSANQTAGSRQ